ncbi:MAG: T9SS type A sorting domain-containing protein [Bacteroidota bacterium]
MRFTLFLLLFALSFSVHSATWIGGDGDWEDPNNWDTGAVPGQSESALLPEGEVILNSKVAVGSVLVEPDAILIVAPGAELGVDPHGGPTFSIDVNGVMYVYGTVRRAGRITTLASLRVQVTGYWETLPGGLVTIERGYLRLNTAQSVYENKGELRVESNSLGVVSEGSLVNRGNMICDGIAASFSGVNVEPTGEWVNYGSATIIDYNTGVRNENRMYNRGEVIITDCDSGIENWGRLDNVNGGVIQMTDIWFTSGLRNRYTSSRIRNWGQIEIEGGDCFDGILNFGRVDNYSSGHIRLNGEFTFQAIQNHTGGNFYNHGSLNIGDDFFTASYGLQNRGTFINYDNGRCRFYADGTSTIVRNSATIENHGYWEITGEIHSSGYLIHTSCGEMLVSGLLRNTGTWLNQSILRIEAGSSFRNPFNLPFINTNVIEDRGGAVNPADITNDGIIAQPYSGAVIGWNPDFFEQRAPGSVALHTSCFVAPEEDEVGKYGIANNDLELFREALGLTELYFYDEDCEHWFAVDVPGGVQSSPSPLVGGGVVYNEQAVDFRVYPNPTQGSARLQLPAMLSEQLYQWHIYSPEGQIMQQGESYPGEQATLDLSTLPNGIYLLRVNNVQGELVYSERLVKQ